MWKSPEERTREQLVGIILLDCITQCNAMKVPQQEYELNLKAMLRERLGSSGQKELVV